MLKKTSQKDSISFSLNRAIWEGEDRKFSPLSLEHRLLKSVKEWQAKYNLTAPWCLHHALYTLERWLDIPTTFRGRQPYDFPASSPRVTSSDEAKEIARQFWESEHGHMMGSNYYYEPAFKHRSKYEATMREFFEQQLKAYCDHIDKLAIERGFQPTIGRFKCEHFTWLVLYQVENKTRQEIASEFNATKEAVDKAVQKLSKFIQLDLRYSGRGKRPK